MRRRTQHALAFALVLALTAGVVGIGWAAPTPYTYTSEIKSTYSNWLTALVTRNTDGSYHYEYTLQYLHAWNNQKLTVFSIGNLTNKAFTNRQCSDPRIALGTSTNSVLWNTGTVPLATTVIFSYDSFWSYGAGRHDAYRRAAFQR